MLRQTKATLNLDCVLTDTEKLAYSKTLAEHISQRQRAADGLKSYSTQAKAEIEGHNGNMNLLSEKLNTGREYRLVECAVEYDWESNTKRYRRSDNFDVARESAITEEEKQEQLKFEEKEAAELKSNEKEENDEKAKGKAKKGMEK